MFLSTLSRSFVLFQFGTVLPSTPSLKLFVLPAAPGLKLGVLPTKTAKDRRIIAV